MRSPQTSARILAMNQSSKRPNLSLRTNLRVSPLQSRLCRRTKETLDGETDREKSKQSQTLRPIKRMRVASTEGKTAILTTLGSTQPGTTQGEKLLLFKPETSPHSISLRGTPIHGSVRKTVERRTPAYVCWRLLVLILLLVVGGCCFAFAKGRNLKGHCRELDCYLSGSSRLYNFRDETPTPNLKKFRRRNHGTSPFTISITTSRLSDRCSETVVCPT